MVPKCKMKRINALSLLAVCVSPEMVEHVWKNAERFQSWDLQLFMAVPPSKAVIARVKRVLKINKVI